MIRCVFFNPNPPSGKEDEEELPELTFSGNLSQLLAQSPKSTFSKPQQAAAKAASKPAPPQKKTEIEFDIPELELTHIKLGAAPASHAAAAQTPVPAAAAAPQNPIPADPFTPPASQFSMPPLSIPPYAVPPPTAGAAASGPVPELELNKEEDALLPPLSLVQKSLAEDTPPTGIQAPKRAPSMEEAQISALEALELTGAYAPARFASTADLPKAEKAKPHFEDDEPTQDVTLAETQKKLLLKDLSLADKPPHDEQLATAVARPVGHAPIGAGLGAGHSPLAEEFAQRPAPKMERGPNARATPNFNALQALRQMSHGHQADSKANDPWDSTRLGTVSRPPVAAARKVDGGFEGLLAHKEPAPAPISQTHLPHMGAAMAPLDLRPKEAAPPPTSQHLQAAPLSSSPQSPFQGLSVHSPFETASIDNTSDSSTQRNIRPGEIPPEVRGYLSPGGGGNWGGAQPLGEGSLKGGVGGPLQGPSGAMAPHDDVGSLSVYKGHQKLAPPGADAFHVPGAPLANLPPLSQAGFPEDRQQKPPKKSSSVVLMALGGAFVLVLGAAIFLFSDDISAFVSRFRARKGGVPPIAIPKNTGPTGVAATPPTRANPSGANPSVAAPVVGGIKPPENTLPGGMQVLGTAPPPALSGDGSGKLLRGALVLDVTPAPLSKMRSYSQTPNEAYFQAIDAALLTGDPQTVIRRFNAPVKTPLSSEKDKRIAAEFTAKYYLMVGEPEKALQALAPHCEQPKPDSALSCVHHLRTLLTLEKAGQAQTYIELARRAGGDWNSLEPLLFLGASLADAQQKPTAEATARVLTEFIRGKNLPMDWATQRGLWFAQLVLSLPAPEHKKLAQYIFAEEAATWGRSLFQPDAPWMTGGDPILLPLLDLLSAEWELPRLIDRPMRVSFDSPVASKGTLLGLASHIWLDPPSLSFNTLSALKSRGGIWLEGASLIALNQSLSDGDLQGAYVLLADPQIPHSPVMEAEWALAVARYAAQTRSPADVQSALSRLQPLATSVRGITSDVPYWVALARLNALMGKDPSRELERAKNLALSPRDQSWVMALEAQIYKAQGRPQESWTLASAGLKRWPGHAALFPLIQELSSQLSVDVPRELMQPPDVQAGRNLRRNHEHPPLLWSTLRALCR